MSDNKRNGLAYDLSLFEPDPKEKKSKENKAAKDDKKEKNDKSKVIRLDTDTSEKAQRRKRNPLLIFVISLLTVAVTAICGFIVYNNVIINELNEKILQANKVIENQNNLEAQYQLQIDRKLTAELVQQYAETKLGMTQANNAQKEFVSLTDGDVGEVINEGERDSFFDTFASMFSGS